MADKNNRKGVDPRRNKKSTATSRSRNSANYRSFQLLDRDEILREAQLSSDYNRRKGYTASRNKRPDNQGYKASNSNKRKKTIKVRKNNLNPIRTIQDNIPINSYEPISNKEISRQTREKRMKLGRLTNVIFIIILIGLLVYVTGYFYTFVTTSNTNISNDIIEYGTIETPESFKGVIIRDEDVYTAGAEGVVSYNVAENEKIKANTVICNVSNAQVVAEMEQDLEKINQEILKMQESRQEISIYTEDVKKYNQQIKETVDKATPAFINNDISQLYTLKNNVQKRIDVRNQMLLSESNGSLAELSDKRIAQENKLASNIKKVSSKTSGIVSYYVDGLEDTFKVDNIAGLTKEQTLMSSNENLTKTTVTKDTPVFKIVNSNQWYIASYINNKYIDSWAAGEHHNIYVTDSYGNTTTINTYVESITTLEKESFIVLKADKYMIDYIDTRTLTFETTQANEGYKIPNSAIVEQTLLKVPAKYVIDNKSVNKISNEETTSVSVSISTEAEDTENVYIPMQIGVINVGDTLVNPADSSDTFKINDTLTKQGIFVMNTGVAEFTVINTVNSITNGTYTILDPAGNPNITIYDKIITDTANIEKQQRIYG